MKNNSFKGNNVGDYPVTIAEKVAVPSMRKRLNDLLDELVEAAQRAMPVDVEDITALTGDQLDSLEVGDKVTKITGTAKHLYVVSYKDAENGGMCLTYTDASTVETVSYDHTEDGWVYNSTDKGSIPPAE